MKPGLSTFRKRLREARKEKGLTQMQFAEGLSFTAPTISAYEKGASAPSLNALIEIAVKYNLSIDWLVGMNSGTLNIRKNRNLC